MNREALVFLSRDDLITLIEAQAQQISVLTAQIAELEAKLGALPKTPDNSSLPPSKGQKPNLLGPTNKKPRPSRPGVARALAEHPDAIVEAILAACPHCTRLLSPADQPDIHAYDHVDLPPIRPIITRINRHRGICPCCRKHFAAAAPEGRDPGSPFRPGLCALIIHTPCHATLTETLRVLDARAVADILGAVVMADNGDDRHIAINGKTLRASKDADGRAEHVLSAFCGGLQTILSHEASRGKGLEIPDALKLLARLDLHDQIVTGDAIFGQKSITQAVVDGGGDYLLPIKNNQKVIAHPPISLIYPERMIGVPQSAARRALSAVRPWRRPVAITVAAAAQTLAPHLERKPFVTFRKITDGRNACSHALLV